MISFELTEEQKQIKELIKDFAEREVDLKRTDELADRAAKAKDVQELREIYPADLIEKLHKVGLRQLCVPEKYGGGGFGRCGAVTRVMACEQMGYSMGIAARLVHVPWMHQAMMSHDSIPEEQKDWFFKQYMADPTMYTALASSEPSGFTEMALGESDEARGTSLVKVRAQKEGNEWVINGDKMFSSGGGVAGLIVTQVRTKEGPLSESGGQFWVAKDSPGMSYTVNKFMIGEICGNVQISFDSVRVPEISMVGKVNTPKVGNPAYAAKMHMYGDMLGHAQRIYEQVVDYAKQRTSFGRPIIERPHIAEMLGEAALDLGSARSFLYKLAWEYDQREAAGAPMPGHLSAGGMYVVKKLAWRLSEIASDVYGGIAMSTDMDLEKFVRRIITWTPPGHAPSMQAITFSMGENSHKIQA